MSRKFEVDTKTFVRFWVILVLFVLLLLFIGKAAEGLIIVGIAIFLAIAIQPLAKFYNRHLSGKGKKSRYTLSAVLAFLSVLAGVSLIVSTIGPVVVNETQRFFQQLPQMFQEHLGGWEGVNSFGQGLGIENLQETVNDGVTGFTNDILGNLGSNLASGVGTLANVTTNIILVLIITLLLLIDGPKLMEGFWKLFRHGNNPEKAARVHQNRHTISRMKDVVATYVSRQLLVAILDGCVVALAVFILSLLFGFSSGLALPMGLITMICYMIPMFGPIIGCILVSLVLLVSEPIAALLFAAFYIVYAQVEANMIAPKIQGNALKMPAVMILIAVVIGIKVAGILGALIAIPIAGCIKVLIDEYPKYKALKNGHYAKVEAENRAMVVEAVAAAKAKVDAKNTKATDKETIKKVDAKKTKSSKNTKK